MSRQERDEFAAYCRTLSDRQVEGVIEKEKEFGGAVEPGTYQVSKVQDEYRAECLQIALDEAENRELDV